MDPESSPLELFAPAASSAGAVIDWVAAIVFTFITLIVVGVLVMMITFAARYRISDRRRRGEPHHNVRRTEIINVGATTALFVGFFGLGAWGFDRALHPPAVVEAVEGAEGAAEVDALDILVTGKQWMWKVQQPTGRREVGQLHVPLGRLVRLHLTSEDVIHSFYVPAFRLKHDVVPGLRYSTWFQATRTGVFPIYCAEYCGLEHAYMHGEVIVMEPRRYEAWLAAEDTAPGEAQPFVAAGRALFERMDCVACHESHFRHRAPPLRGLFGRTVYLETGETLIADEAYIRNSILRPTAQIVAGYDPVMPPYEGILSDEELFALVAYLREISDPQGVHR